jgi:hypothetical protein
MAYTRRTYAGGAAATTISGALASNGTSITIAAYTGWPYHATDPFYVVVAPGTATEEKILVTRTTSTSTTLNVVTRGVDGTTAAAQASGATIYPVFTAVDADEANAVASTLTTKGDLLTYTGTAYARTGVGSNNTVLVADSAQTNGIKWSATLAGLTLTSPVISSISNTGTLTLPTSTDTLVGRATTDTLTNKTLTSPVISTISNTGTLTLPTSTDTLVGRATTDTLTNKTLTSPTITTPSISGAVLVEAEETWNVSATAATGTVNMDVLTASAWYYTSNASANWTFNFRGNSGTTLNNTLATNDSITVAFAVTQGTTAYYASAFQIDGTSVTPKWANNLAPSAGNASSIDVYTFTIVKTASATFTVFGSQTQFK